MSTLKVNKLRDTAGSADAITLDPNGGAVLAGVTTMTTARVTSGIVTNTFIVGAGVTISESGIEASGIGITCANINGTQIGGRRNKVINGAMMVDQRSEGSASTNISNHLTVDRFRIVSSNTDQLAATIQQNESTSGAPPGSGLTHVLKWTTTTPETAIANDEAVRFQYHIEGQDLQDFCYGTSSAKTVTVSFYVKTSVTGVYAFSIYRDESTDRMINRTYTVSDTNWNRYTFTIAGDTASKISDSISSKWRMMFHLAAGSDYTGSSHATWGNYSVAHFAGGHAQNGVCTTNGATWELTGVQLEVGSQVTPFEHRSVGEELLLCQRYYYRMQNGSSGSYWVGHVTAYGSNNNMLMIFLPVCMRDNPSLGVSSTNSDFQFWGGGTVENLSNTPTLRASVGINPQVVPIDLNHGITTGHSRILRLSNQAFFEFSAEL